MSEPEGDSAYTELEQAFFNDGYSLASEQIGEELTPEILFQSMEKLYIILDSFLQSFLKNAEDSGSPAKCSEGCAYCCHQAVFAQTHELKYLKNWLFENLKVEELETIRKKAKEKYAHLKGLSPEAALLHKESCPLLKNNLCAAYSARPCACRIYLSSDLNSCIQEFKHPEDKSSFPNLYDLPFRAGQKLNEGYVARLKELGMDIDELRLEEGLGM